MRSKVLQFFILFFHVPLVRFDPRHRYQRIINIIRRLQLALGLVLISIAIGTVGFMFLENYSLLDAWYMSMITLSTVGFGEVHQLDAQGRLFTSFLILFNVGIFAYSISSIVSLFAEGSFSTILTEFRMSHTIDSLSGHTIICGFGRHATEVTQELSKQGDRFVIIENNPEKIVEIRTETDYLYIDGDATHDEILEEAGIHRAKAVVVTLPDDADVLFVVLSARQINPGLRIIARANNVADEIKMKRAGADQTVVPERIGGFYMATLVNKPDLVEFFSLLSNMGPSNVVFEEIAVLDLKEKFLGKSISESGIAGIAQVSLIAIRHTGGQYELNPKPSLVLDGSLHLVILGNPEQVSQFRTESLA